jgi:hypothetical protein
MPLLSFSEVLCCAGHFTVCSVAENSANWQHRFWGEGMGAKMDEGWASTACNSLDTGHHSPSSLQALVCSHV